jgi:hypothetical protein
MSGCHAQQAFAKKERKKKRKEEKNRAEQRLKSAGEKKVVFATK